MRPYHDSMTTQDVEEMQLNNVLPKELDDLINKYANENCTLKDVREAKDRIDAIIRSLFYCAPLPKN
jgi:hypothetical protein